MKKSNPQVKKWLRNKLLTNDTSTRYLDNAIPKAVSKIPTIKKEIEQATLVRDQENSGGYKWCKL